MFPRTMVYLYINIVWVQYMCWYIIMCFTIHQLLQKTACWLLYCHWDLCYSLKHRYVVNHIDSFTVLSIVLIHINCQSATLVMVNDLMYFKLPQSSVPSKIFCNSADTCHKWYSLVKTLFGSISTKMYILCINIYIFVILVTN